MLRTRSVKYALRILDSLTCAFVAHWLPRSFILYSRVALPPRIMRLAQGGAFLGTNTDFKINEQESDFACASNLGLVFLTEQ